MIYQENNRGGKIRQVLNEQLGVPTIPQIFIGGEHLGGSAELFDAYKSGDLQKRLRRLEIAFDGSAAVNPEDMLPQWLHPRKSA